MSDVNQGDSDRLGTEVGASISASSSIIGSKDARVDSSDHRFSPIAIAGNQDPVALILFHVSAQNSLLQSVMAKLDGHIDRVEDRFRGLETATNKLDISVNALADRVRQMEKTNADLEHASTSRGLQTNSLEQQVNSIKTAQLDMGTQMVSLKNEVMALRGDIPRPMPQAIVTPQVSPAAQTIAVIQTRSIMWLGIALIVALAIVFVAGWWLRGGI